MTVFKAITTKEQAEALDNSLCVKGYFAGLKSIPDYTQKEQAYWHGYLNGQVDSDKMAISEEQRKLAEDYVHKSRMN